MVRLTRPLAIHLAVARAACGISGRGVARRSTTGIRPDRMRPGNTAWRTQRLFRWFDRHFRRVRAVSNVLAALRARAFPWILEQRRRGGGRLHG